MEPSREFCDNCNIELKRSVSCTRKVNFLSLIHHTNNVRVCDAFYYIFPSTPRVSDQVLQNKNMCRKCSDFLGRAYTNLLAFKSGSNKDSYCYKQYDFSSGPTQSNSVESQTKLTGKMMEMAMKKTPIWKQMKRAKAGDRQSQSNFYKCVRRMIHDEIKSASKGSCMRNNPDMELILPSTESTEEELKRECPTVLAVLQGLCLKQKTTQIFTPAMSTIYGVCLNQQSQQCTLFQKAIGLILWKTKADEKTYHQLSNFGLCVSYKTTVSTLDELRKDYERQIISWKLAAAELLRQNQSGASSSTQSEDDHAYAKPRIPEPKPWPFEKRPRRKRKFLHAEPEQTPRTSDARLPVGPQPTYIIPEQTHPAS